MRRFLRQFRFFLWNLSICFGMILVSSVSSAAEKDLYNAHGRRDPFTPLVTSTTKSSSSNLLGVDSVEHIVVEGVVCDPQHGSLAIVNGTILKEGEELAGIKVLKVASSGVYFLINGAESFKQIYQEDATGKNVKKP